MTTDVLHCTDKEFADYMRSCRTSPVLTEAEMRHEAYEHDQYDLTPQEWLESHQHAQEGASAH